MASIPPLAPDRLRLVCDASALGFATTAELPDDGVTAGQARALEAVRFGLGISHEGFNLFALGPPGTGKHGTIGDMLATEAARRAPPSDCCYVHNFESPHRPRAIALPAGVGARFRHAMEQLVAELRITLPAAFDNEDTQSRLEEIEEEFKQRRAEALEALRNEAREKRIALFETPAGFSFAPFGATDEVMRPDQFEQLSDEAKSRIRADVEALQERLQKLLRQFQGWRKEMRERVMALHHDIAQFAVGHALDALREAFADHPPVLAHLDAVQSDLVANYAELLPGSGQQQGLHLALGGGADPWRRYAVNLLVDNSALEGAPVVYERLPSHANLLGRTEHQAQMGTLVSDFTLIKAGALHRANGGFLVLDARRVLMQPLAWESLKRALEAREITIEPLERTLSLMSTVGLEPEPVPLDVKVVLVGDRRLYYLLFELDPDFRKLFKVAVDFEDAMDRTPESERAYAALVGAITRRESLRALESGAVAAVIERAAREAGNATRLSLELRRMSDLLCEADHVAGAAGREVVTAADVEAALREREHRLDRMRERVHDLIRRGIILIDLEGESCGQLNGLSVLDIGGFAFCQPSRITATARPGEGSVVDVQREVELGGPIHSKGVLILASFLMSRFGRDHPVSLSASLVFEQSYGMIDGDSASLAELCALLSVLSGCPIRQGLAVTGSVNQHGDVQPIGAVNEKIEGFFDVCVEHGLDGHQGVVIPDSNVGDLMLRADVVEAAAAGRFSVWAVKHADEAIELLTGVPAGAPDVADAAPDSVNGRVRSRLVELADIRREFANPEGGGRKKRARKKKPDEDAAG